MVRKTDHKRISSISTYKTGAICIKVHIIYRLIKRDCQNLSIFCMIRLMNAVYLNALVRATNLRCLMNMSVCCITTACCIHTFCESIVNRNNRFLIVTHVPHSFVYDIDYLSYLPVHEPETVVIYKFKMAFDKMVYY